MQINLNGNPHQLLPNTTITQLISDLDLTGKRIAVELNQQIISRSQYSATIINENDTIELVQAIGGG